MLHASPALAARFPAIIDFPGYTPAQLTVILHALAAEAGLTFTPDAATKAAAVLAAAENGQTTGNARLAVQLLTQATTNQALRVTTGPQFSDPAALAAICAADIPGHLPLPEEPASDQHLGQYLLHAMAGRHLRHPEEAASCRAPAQGRGRITAGR